MNLGSKYHYITPCKILKSISLCLLPGCKEGSVTIVKFPVGSTVLKLILVLLVEIYNIQS